MALISHFPQSALTGESLPVTKNPGDGVYSGSTCKQGEIDAVVIATGVHTFFGKAAHLVDTTNQVGHFQKVLFSFNSLRAALKGFHYGNVMLSFHSFAGSHGNWKLLHLFYCNWDGSGDNCHVSDPRSDI